MNSFTTTRDWTLLIAILTLGIGFGAINAMTPGHGKMVLAYLLGSRLAAVRSAGVAAVLAVTHVGSAVLIAVLGLPLLSKALGSVGRAPSLEMVSRGLLATIGLWLVLRASRGAKHQHDDREGLMVGVTAGLAPCPLTLFAMGFAMACEVLQAGLTFALAMVVGVGLALVLVALLATFAKDRLMAVVVRHGASIQIAGRVLDGVAGAVLVLVATRALLG